MLSVNRRVTLSQAMSKFYWGILLGTLLLLCAVLYPGELSSQLRGCLFFAGTLFAGWCWRLKVRDDKRP